MKIHKKYNIDETFIYKASTPWAKSCSDTLYALSAPPIFTVPASAVSRDVLLTAISDRTLASAELGVTYSRPFTGTATR